LPDGPALQRLQSKNWRNHSTPDARIANARIANARFIFLLLYS
jgi:hypothetical protein